VAVRLRKVIQKRIRDQRDGTDIVADLNAVVAANVREPGTSAAQVSSQNRIVQKFRRKRGG
jgi:hypothetical protein